MTYTIHAAGMAKEDQRDNICWYAENYSEDYAKQWNDGIDQAIHSLRENPQRCAFVHENDRLSEDVRQLLYGKSKKHRHRVLFTIAGNTVYIVRIRHSAQKDIEQADLPVKNI